MAAGFLPEYARLVAQFGLPPRKKLKTLSKGMHAKVVLSLALAHQPELLILDEPTSGLDALVRREFLESMVDRAAQGQTVFLSSHQIGEVERVADIVAILRKGKLLLVEPLDELKAQVRRLTVTLKDGARTLPDFGGKILSQRWKPRQWQALVRGVGDEQLADACGPTRRSTAWRSTRRAWKTFLSPTCRAVTVLSLTCQVLLGAKTNRPKAATTGVNLEHSSMTTAAIFWRLFWKEYRLQRALWIAMAVLTTLLMLLVVEFTLVPRTDSTSMFGIAVALPAFYCLGCGATLFAGRTRGRHYEFQRSLPVGAGRVFAAKIAFALLSTIVAVRSDVVAGVVAERWNAICQDAPDHGESDACVMFLVGPGLFGLECFCGRRSSPCCSSGCSWPPFSAWRPRRSILPSANSLHGKRM